MRMVWMMNISSEDIEIVLRLLADYIYAEVVVSKSGNA
jgi:hypothetical protein